MLFFEQEGLVGVREHASELKQQGLLDGWLVKPWRQYTGLMSSWKGYSVQMTGFPKNATSLPKQKPGTLVVVNTGAPGIQSYKELVDWHLRCEMDMMHNPNGVLATSLSESLFSEGPDALDESSIIITHFVTGDPAVARAFEEWTYTGADYQVEMGITNPKKPSYTLAGNIVYDLEVLPDGRYKQGAK